MPAIENGRVCVKLFGRDSGRLCVITDVVDEKFSKILAVGRKKKRRVNIRHLKPLEHKLELKESDEALLKKLSDMQRQIRT